MPVAGFTVFYTVNGGTPFSQIYTGSLVSGATTNFSFTTWANLSVAGTYNVEVTVTMTGDPVAANNATMYTVINTSYNGLPPVFDFEPGGNGIAQFKAITKTRSAISEDAGASFGSTSTKGMIIDGVNHTSWNVPTVVVDPWNSNAVNFSAVYICFSTTGGSANDSLLLTFDLKQLYKAANVNTNFRVTVNGAQVGPTYRPPFSGMPINWQKVKVDLSQYKNDPNIQIGLESSVKEAYANGAGTANLIDNIVIKRVTGPTCVKDDLLQSLVNVFPNPSAGLFNVSCRKEKPIR
ncbi:hypothetical protein I5M27_02750 [Adhaeribacter sp. BT258]|uniref:Uncharacterized protein n=1 Tax=Adhaeribacter terrigena TaxID=2793070 RepID=A0ABS1BY91_9BACT|nr:hypothetical protein [Adhaeribacter terrigena]MBK0401886.1 hypothetical protein [Adhaeribacter terrigena]